MADTNGDQKITIPNLKKAKFDHRSVKQILDGSVIEIVKKLGYVEKYRLGIMIKMGIMILIKGIACIVLGLSAPVKKLYDLEDPSIICFILFIIGTSIIIKYLKVKNVFLFTYPLKESSNYAGLAISSKLPKFSDMYTLTIASAQPIAMLNPPVAFTKSFTHWFTSDGVLVEDLFLVDVQELVNECYKVKKIGLWSHIILVYLQVPF